MTRHIAISTLASAALYLIVIAGLLALAPKAHARAACTPWGKVVNRERPERPFFQKSWSATSSGNLQDRSISIMLKVRHCVGLGERYYEASAGAKNLKATGKTDFAIALKYSKSYADSFPDEDSPSPRAWHPRIRVGQTWWSPSFRVSLPSWPQKWPNWHLVWVEAHTFYANGYQGFHDYYMQSSRGIVGPLLQYSPYFPDQSGKPVFPR